MDHGFGDIDSLFVIVDELPRNAIAKFLKRVLQDDFGARWGPRRNRLLCRTPRWATAPRPSILQSAASRSGLIDQPRSTYQSREPVQIKRAPSVDPLGDDQCYQHRLALHKNLSCLYQAAQPKVCTVAPGGAADPQHAPDPTDLHAVDRGPAARKLHEAPSGRYPYPLGAVYSSWADQAVRQESETMDRAAF